MMTVNDLQLGEALEKKTGTVKNISSKTRLMNCLAHIKSLLWLCEH